MYSTCGSVTTQRMELEQKNKQISRELHRSLDLLGVKVEIVHIEDCSIKLRVCLKEIHRSWNGHVILFRVGGERMNINVRNIDGPGFGCWFLESARRERWCYIVIIVLFKPWWWWWGRHSCSDWKPPFPRQDVWSGLLCWFRNRTVIQYRLDVFVACELHDVSRCNVFVPEHLDHSLANRVVSQALTVQPALLSHPLNHVSQFIEADPLHNKPLAIWSCQSPGPRRNVEWTSWLTISTWSLRGKQLVGCDGVFEKSPPVLV